MTSSADPCRSPGLVPLAQALEQILSGIAPLPGDEWVPVHDAGGRILACDLQAPMPLPAFTNAAMDGYAVRAQDRGRLKVIGTAWAGKAFPGRVEAGTCVRIFTGAPLPEGADAVVMQEQVAREGDTVILSAPVRPGENVRHAGEDLERGAVLLSKGKRLQAADLGLLAAAGVSQVPVCLRPRVGFFSSGDELRPLTETLQPGQIYDSNRYTLEGLLRELPVVACDLGAQPDDLERLGACLRLAAEHTDVLISTGGASVGEADLLRQALIQAGGEIHLWRLALKPGKPLIFGRVGRTWYFGLPGNPVSVHVTFRQLVRPALWRLAGGRPYRTLRLQVPCTHPLKKDPGRLEFQRGRLHYGDDGKLAVTALSRQGSHQLAALSRANCYIVLPADSRGVNAGETVTVEPFTTDLVDD
ncbi:molybdopterin molybdotransferase [Methylomarinovum tepidoasis]|uniref:Molybdopterin molybdenumtransferase n=1 Tax=Methylomarinovum tepidoasis TaxID=2840183 RepID=A0AAU9CUV5_9GAMM|nr:gephyrin-like molybdotransferase Glp [Methylomarinovum sp. IN45]BCX87869.1 molybdopterin molybdotransferase [Methylomarinovum sp. IN45]